MHKKLYGLIGYPLGHSFSESYFRDKFARENIHNAEYRNFPLKNADEIRAFLAETPGLCGINVTIPHKETILSFLDSIDDVAETIGAVNCVKISDGKLRGYNTDAPAFRDTLLELIGSDRPKALVLGTGGAAKGVKYSLNELGIDYVSVSRTRSANSVSYSDITPEQMDNYQLVINTTPLGMFPDTGSLPDLPYEGLTGRHFMYDLVYNPAETEFMKKGKERGAKVVNGLGMLHGQAELAWRIWNG